MNKSPYCFFLAFQFNSSSNPKFPIHFKRLDITISSNFALVNY